MCVNVWSSARYSYRLCPFVYFSHLRSSEWTWNSLWQNPEGRGLNISHAFGGIMWALLYQNTLCQQQKALWGEQVGQGWGAALWLLPATRTVRSIPDSSLCYFQDLHHRAEIPPWLIACNQPSSCLLPQAPSQALWAAILSTLWKESRYSGLEGRCPPSAQKQDFFLSVSSSSCALRTRPKAAPPSGSDPAGISALPLPTVRSHSLRPRWSLL